MRFGMLQMVVLSLLTNISFIVAWRVQPRNYLLFACHATNASLQAVQDTRFVRYWYMGGRERKLGLTDVAGAAQGEGKVLQAIKAAEEGTSKKA